MNPDNDPYFPNDEHDMMQESNLFPWVDDDPSYDNDYGDTDYGDGIW